MKVLSGARVALERHLAGQLAVHVGLDAVGVGLVDDRAITKNVRNSARPMSTWFGGVVGVPSAWRRIDSTMMMRVNAVIISSIAGSSVSTVIRIKT